MCDGMCTRCPAPGTRLANRSAGASARFGELEASTVTEDLRVLDEADPDNDTAFDVPAFLRRQEG